MFKPMLASKLEGTPRFPVYASPKYDGIRALVINGVVVSRNMKPIPSKFVQENFSKFEGFDGELMKMTLVFRLRSFPSSSAVKLNPFFSSRCNGTGFAPM